MSYDEPVSAPSSGNNTVLIIVLVLLGVFLLIGAICGGAVYFAVKTTEKMADTLKDLVEEQQRQQVESERAAQLFIDEIRGNRLEAAYRSMTPELQQRMTLEEWQKLIAKHPGLTEGRPGERTRVTRPNPFEAAEGQSELEAELDLGKGKKAQVKLTVIRDGETWKVDAVEISDRTPTAPPGK